MGHPELYFLTNFQKFNERGFDQNAISNLSHITAKHIDKHDPSQMLGRVNFNTLTDHERSLHIVKTSFFDLSIDEPIISFVDSYPSKYQFTGLRIYRSLDVVEIERVQYAYLSFLGDVGGLISILTLIGVLLIKRVAQYKAHSCLQTEIVPVYQGRWFVNLLKCRKVPNDEELDLVGIIKTAKQNRVYFETLLSQD